jgi:hypothetical protein
MVHQTTCSNSLDDKEQGLRIKAHYDDNIELKIKQGSISKKENNFMI